MDEYLDELQTERRQALWSARLSTGEVVTMDDGRPGLEPESAWLRLASRCASEGVSVRELWLHFRSNVVRSILPTDAAGYFFSKAVMGFLTSGQTHWFFLVGHLVGDEVHVQKWAVPELILMETEVRPADGCGPCLIRSPAGP